MQEFLTSNQILIDMTKLPNPDQIVIATMAGEHDKSIFLLQQEAKIPRPKIELNETMKKGRVFSMIQKIMH